VRTEEDVLNAIMSPPRHTPKISFVENGSFVSLPMKRPLRKEPDVLVAPVTSSTVFRRER